MLLSKNLKDKKVMYTVFLAVVLVALHSWQYVKSGYEIRALLNLTLSAIYIPVVLIFGFSAMPYFLLTYCFIYLPFEQFDNYTSLFLLCSAISLKRKLAYCFIPYIIETVSVYMLNGNEISHIAITLIYIFLFWQIYCHILNKHADFEPLDLKEEERKILNELAKGKQQKEIDFYSHVTVSKKLKEARERNNCISTDELVTKFKSTNQIN